MLASRPSRHSRTLAAHAVRGRPASFPPPRNRERSCSCASALPTAWRNLTSSLLLERKHCASWERSLVPRFGPKPSGCHLACHAASKRDGCLHPRLVAISTHAVARKDRVACRLARHATHAVSPRQPCACACIPCLCHACMHVSRTRAFPRRMQMEGKGISTTSARAAHPEDDLPADRPARAALGPGSMQTDSTRARASR